MAELTYFAPAKVNFSLLLRGRDKNGYHPLKSLVQSLDWGDTVEFDSEDDDNLEVVGADLATDGSNLIWQAIEAVGGRRPRLAIRLTKRIPVAAGLGGGSSDAAAALLAMETFCRPEEGVIETAAASVGADVAYFLTGGPAWMEGYGERITRLDRLSGFAVAVVVPPFELPTPEVYQRWDDCGEPEGEEISRRGLPPPLRSLGPVRNDLTPAAISLRPELGDWISDLASRWGRPVAMSGSGPSLFGLFADPEEAGSAASEAAADARCALGTGLSTSGAIRTD